MATLTAVVGARDASEVDVQIVAESDAPVAVQIAGLYLGLSFEAAGALVDRLIEVLVEKGERDDAPF